MDVTKCSKGSCGKYYHVSCLENNDKGYIVGEVSSEGCVVVVVVAVAAVVVVAAVAAVVVVAAVVFVTVAVAVIVSISTALERE